MADIPDSMHPAFRKHESIQFYIFELLGDFDYEKSSQNIDYFYSDYLLLDDCQKNADTFTYEECKFWDNTA